MDYASLKSSVNDWLARSDVSDSTADLLIDLGEARINRTLRIRAMEAVYTSALDADGTSAIPTGYREFKSLFLAKGLGTVPGSTIGIHALADASTVRRIEWRTDDAMFAEYEGTKPGDPLWATRYGDRIMYWPADTTVTFTAAGIYYKDFTALSSSATTNWLTDNAPDLLLAAVLYEASVYIQSESRMATWKPKYEQALAEVQGESERQEFAATPLSQRATGYLP